MRNNINLVVAGLLLIGAGYGAAKLIEKAVDSGYSELAKSAVDGVSKVSQEFSNNKIEKASNSLSSEALKLSIDALEQDRVNRQNKWWYR